MVYIVKKLQEAIGIDSKGLRAFLVAEHYGIGRRLLRYPVAEHYGIELPVSRVFHRRSTGVFTRHLHLSLSGKGGGKSGEYMVGIYSCPLW